MAPAKGQELTEEHKEKLMAARDEANEGQAEAREKHEEATAEFVAENEAAKADAQQKALEEAERIRREQAEQALAEKKAREVPAPVTPPSFTPSGSAGAQSRTEWGPYAEYVLAETPYGRYAVEPGYVMFFEPYEFFDDREKRMRTSHRPVYIWYGSGPAEHDEDGNVTKRADPNYGKNRDQLVRGLPDGVRAPVPGPVESQAVGV